MAHNLPHPIYRFGPDKDSSEIRAAGDVVPHRMFSYQRQRMDGTWEVIGYVDAHLHVVKVDETDREDVSVGVTVRFNPKIEGAASVGGI